MSDQPTRAELVARRPRTRRLFSDADMERLHDLYFDRGVPFPSVASAFGVSSSTLSQWLAEMGWPQRRVMPYWATTEPPVASPPAAAPPPSAAAAPPLPEPVAEANGLPETFDLDMLRLDIKRAARTELEALRREPPPRGWADRERRARALGSLLRTIDRVDKDLDTTAQARALGEIEAMLRDGPRVETEIGRCLREVRRDLLRLMRQQAERLLEPFGGRPFGPAAPRDPFAPRVARRSRAS